LSADPVRRRYTHKYLILAICCSSLFIVSMDATVVNVALPSIGRELDSSISGLQWTIDGYTLVLASLLLLSGSTADRLGRRRTFQLGLVLFGAGSLLCSLAPTVTWLVIFRMLQAVGGSMLNPVAMSIITATFTDRKQRARAVGMWSAVVGVAMGVGPLAGGALTSLVGWRSIFWINVPIALAAIVLTAVFVPESRSAVARRFDPIGQLLVIVALGTLVGGLIEGPRLGWHSPATLGLFGATLIAVVGLVLYEPRRRDPLLDVRFFRSIPFSSAVVTAVFAFAANGAFLFLVALYLQGVRGLTPFEAGLHTLPIAAAQLLCAPLSGRMVAAWGTRVPLVAAGVAFAAGGALMSVLTPTTAMPYLLCAFGVFGIGMGLVNAPVTTTAVSGMPRGQSGSAAAVASTSRQLGTSLGVAIAGSVLAGSAASGADGAAFAQATHPVWWLIVGLGGVILTLAVVANSAWGRRSAGRIAHLFDEPAAEVTLSPEPIAT
jgi:EmrB/QacA subfamily drug resistance transporter